MRKSTKSAIAITLAIVGAIASPFSSDAAALELKEDSRSFCNPTRIELKSRVVKVADSDIITILDAEKMRAEVIPGFHGVETRVMNQSVKRYEERFPVRFRFKLTQDEMDELITNCDKSGRLKHYPGLPYVFTEQGVAMLASVLRFTKMDAGEIGRIKKVAFASETRM